LETSDAELVRRTRCGNRRAFAELVERYRNSVYGLAFHCLGSREDAQDAAQEAFVQAYGRLGQLREPDKFAVWLRRLTLNGCADHRRRCARTAPYGDEVGYQVQSADSSVDRLTTRLAVQEALGRLPERTRLAVVLCHLEGYSHEEASRFLGIPVGTVRSRLQHAKRQLREEMRDMVSEELNGGRPDADWTRRVVEEAMRRGDDALRAYQRGDAVRHYDEALTAITTFPTGAERTRATVTALLQKERAIRYTRSAAEADSLLEQALALVGRMDDPQTQADILRRLGDGCASGAPEKSVEYYRDALDLLRRVGDVPGQGHCLLSLALHSLRRNENAIAQGHLEQAQALFEQADCLDWIAVCRALRDLPAEVGEPDLSRLILWHAVCDVLEMKAGAVRFRGQPGFMVTQRDDAVPQALYVGSVFWQLSRLGAFLDAGVPIGGAWAGDTFSFSDRPLRTTLTVLSDSEPVTVPAGTFAGCLLTEQVTAAGGDPDDAPEASHALNRRELCGAIRAWYAPSVGLVQVHVRRGDGVEAAIQLRAYQVGGESEEYLPLALGNRWVYGWADVPSDYDAGEVYQVTGQADSLWFLSHYAYAFRGSRAT